MSEIHLLISFRFFTEARSFKLQRRKPVGNWEHQNGIIPLYVYLYIYIYIWLSMYIYIYIYVHQNYTYMIDYLWLSMIVYVHTTTIYLLYAQTWIDRFPRGHLIRFKLLQDTSPSKWWNRLIPPMDQLAMAMASEDYSEVSYKWETLKNTSLRNEYCIFASHTIVSTYVYIYT